MPRYWYVADNRPAGRRNQNKALPKPYGGAAYTRRNRAVLRVLHAAAKLHDYGYGNDVACYPLLWREWLAALAIDASPLPEELLERVPRGAEVIGRVCAHMQAAEGTQPDPDNPAVNRGGNLGGKEFPTEGTEV